MAAARLPTPFPTVSGPLTDDWVTQDHDFHRTGFQGQQTGLTSATASQLTLRWEQDLGVEIDASPIVAGGHVYVADANGRVFSFDAATGEENWSASVGGPVRGTPTLDGSVLLVGIHTAAAGAMVALNATNGVMLWRTPVSAWGAVGAVRSEPLVANGIVYVGTANGDPPACNPGTVAALTESTGSLLWSWRSAGSGMGVAVWSPISLGPNGSVLFGTGNACGSSAYAESFIALNSVGGVLDWQSPTDMGAPDADVGGGIAEAGGLGFFTSKDGHLYAIDVANGRQVWQASLGSVGGYGSIATPATDGSNVVTQSGALSDPTHSAVPGSMLYDFGVDGSLRWTAGPFQDEEFSSPAITADVTVVGIDHTLQVRSLATGALLWACDAGSFVYASPAVVPSGVYITTTGGKVLAFGLPASMGLTRTRRPRR